MNRHRALATGAACALAVVVLALLVAPTPAVTTPIDAWWQETMEGARPDGAVTVARVLSYVGGGWVAVWLCPILLAVAALIVRGWRTAIVVVVMLLLSTTTVQVVKNLVARERPDGMLVDSDFGSFPSGHAANAATIAVVLWLILPRVLGLILGAIILVLLLIFVIQNNQTAGFEYFSAQFDLPLGVAMLLAAIAGALVMALVGSMRMIQMSWTIRKLRKQQDKIHRATR